MRIYHRNSGDMICLHRLLKGKAVYSYNSMFSTSRWLAGILSIFGVSCRPCSIEFPSGLLPPQFVLNRGMGKSFFLWLVSDAASYGVERGSMSSRDSLALMSQKGLYLVAMPTWSGGGAQQSRSLISSAVASRGQYT